jgi:hypothetical protein
MTDAAHTCCRWMIRGGVIGHERVVVFDDDSLSYPYLATGSYILYIYVRGVMDFSGL